MRYRKLGRTGIEISDIGFGAWGIGGKQWLGGSDEESRAALTRALELGCNFIDTALAYGDGFSFDGVFLHQDPGAGKLKQHGFGKFIFCLQCPPEVGKFFIVFQVGGYPEI